MVNRCVNGEPHVLSPVDYLGEGVEVQECIVCRREFVLDAGDLIPVEPSVMTIEAIADEDRLGWDGQREHGAGLDSYWGRLDA